MVVRGADAWHAPVGSRAMATATGTAPRTAAAGPPGSPACPAPAGGRPGSWRREYLRGSPRRPAREMRETWKKARTGMR